MNNRVVIVITRMVSGGASRVVKNLISGLSDDFVIDLITGEQNLPPKLGSDIPSVNRVLVLPSLVRDIRPTRDLKAFRELVELFRERNYSLVHTHTSKTGLLGRWAGSWVGIDNIIHTPHGLIYDRPERIPGVPSSGLRLWSLKYIEKLTSSCHDLLTTLTERERHQAISLGFGQSENVRVIYNGVDLDHYQRSPDDRSRAREKFGIGEDDFLLVSTGRVAEEKGYRLLIESFHQLREREQDIRLLVAGDGPLLPTLRDEESGAIDSGELILPGHLDDVRPVYWAADLYVHPAYYEGFGLSILEAMVAGCPVVATDVGGVPELVEDGRSGLLIDPGSVTELTDAVETVVRNSSKRKKLSKHAKKRARDFSLDTMIERYRSLYNELLESNSANKQGESHGVE